VIEAAMATARNFPPVKLDPGAVVVDKSNMNQPDVGRLLKPPTEKL
jgi:ribose transport system substrate-binding protein